MIPANTLVRHKKRKTLGIGYVSRERMREGKQLVIFRDMERVFCLPEDLRPVDVSGCSTVTIEQVRQNVLSPVEGFPKTIIVGNTVRTFMPIVNAWRRVGAV